MNNPLLQLNPVDVLAPLFGGKRRMAEALEVLPSAVSNWGNEGIPDARKWQISQQLRAMRAAGEITKTQFLEAIEALEAPEPAVA